MSLLDNKYKCSKCGCTGIHACIGRPIEPIPDEEAEKLYALIESLYNEEKKLTESKDEQNY